MADHNANLNDELLRSAAFLCDCHNADPDVVKHKLNANANLHLITHATPTTNAPFPYIIARGSACEYRGKECIPCFVSASGTVSFSHVMVDLCAFVAPPFNGIDGKVHAGFYNAFNSMPLAFLDRTIRDGLPIDDAMPNGERLPVHLFLCGHSLGAALAQLMCAWLINVPGMGAQCKNRVTMLGLGSPLVGDKEYASSYDLRCQEYGVRNFQFIHKDDIVPAMIHVVHATLSSLETDSSDSTTNSNNTSNNTSTATSVANSLKKEAQKMLPALLNVISADSTILQTMGSMIPSLAQFVGRCLRIFIESNLAVFDAHRSGAYCIHELEPLSTCAAATIAATAERFTLLDYTQLLARLEQHRQRSFDFVMLQHHLCHNYVKHICRNPHDHDVGCPVQTLTSILPRITGLAPHGSFKSPMPGIKSRGRFSHYIVLSGSGLDAVTTVRLVPQMSEPAPVREFVPEPNTTYTQLAIFYVDRDDSSLDNAPVKLVSPFGTTSSTLPGGIRTQVPLLNDGVNLTAGRIAVNNLPPLQLFFFAQFMTLVDVDTSRKQDVSLLLDCMETYGAQLDGIPKLKTEMELLLKKVRSEQGRHADIAQILKEMDAVFYEKAIKEIQERREAYSPLVSVTKQVHGALETLEEPRWTLSPEPAHGKQLQAETTTTTRLEALARARDAEAVAYASLRTIRDPFESPQGAPATAEAGGGEVGRPTIVKAMSDSVPTLLRAYTRLARPSLKFLTHPLRIFGLVLLGVVIAAATIGCAVAAMAAMAVVEVAGAVLAGGAAISAGAAAAVGSVITAALVALAVHIGKALKALDHDYYTALADVGSRLGIDMSARPSGMYFSEAVIVQVLKGSFGFADSHDLLKFIRTDPTTVKHRLLLLCPNDGSKTCPSRIFEKVKPTSELRLAEFLHQVYIMYELRDVLSKVVLVGITGESKCGKTTLMERMRCEGRHGLVQGSTTENTVDVAAYMLHMEPSETCKGGPVRDFLFIDFPGFTDPRVEIAGALNHFGGMLDMAIVLTKSTGPADQTRLQVAALLRRKIPMLVCHHRADEILQRPADATGPPPRPSFSLSNPESFAAPAQSIRSKADFDAKIAANQSLLLPPGDGLREIADIFLIQKATVFAGTVPTSITETEFATICRERDIWGVGDLLTKWLVPALGDYGFIDAERDAVLRAEVMGMSAREAETAEGEGEPEGARPAREAPTE